MKTSSMIFAPFFFFIGLFAAGCALNGAIHQWAIAGIGIAIGFILLADALKKEEANK